MSEFRVHHLVSELLDTLGISTAEHADSLVQLLSARDTPSYAPSQLDAHRAKAAVSNASATGAQFLTKYQDLKTTQARELDPLVYVLSRATENEKIKELLESAQDPAVPTVTVPLTVQHTTTGLNDVDIQKLREDLARFTTGPDGGPRSTAILDLEEAQRLRRKLWKLERLPQMPRWGSDRAFLTADFPSFERRRRPEQVQRLGTLPLELQELAVVEDLLFLMVGVDGRFIHVSSTTPFSVVPTQATPSAAHGVPGAKTGGSTKQRPFEFDDSMDVSLKEVLLRVLPLASNYSTVARFIEVHAPYKTGKVNQALTSAMRTLIKEYLILVAQLEHQFNQGALGLQALYFYVQPCLHTLDLLASIAQSIHMGKCEGGKVLTLLHERTLLTIGDSKAQELCLHLMATAAAPYFEMLEQWVYKGTIHDPYSEFLVEEKEAMRKERMRRDYNDHYWSQHYTIVPDRIPSFLGKVADKVLNAGKYLNVIRQCGRDVQCPFAEELAYTFRERTYFDQIERAHHYASRVLLDLLMTEMQLMNRLRSIKHYFLMGQGDFFVHFMDVADGEMQKSLTDIIPERLETLLELALRTSAARLDPFKDDLRCGFVPYNLVTELFRIMEVSHDYKGNQRGFVDLSKAAFPEPDVVGDSIRTTGLEAFTFEYTVQFPLSLILNKRALKRYQLLFRHLMGTKNAERKLCAAWAAYQGAKLHPLRARLFATAMALRQRMIHFIENFEYYMMFEVIEPHWHILEQRMGKVSTIDDVLKHHNNFLDNCLKECMLTNPHLLKLVNKLLCACVTFADYMQRSGEHLSLGAHDAKHQGLRAGRTVKEKNFMAFVSNADNAFSSLVYEFMDALSGYSTSESEAHMANMVTRLDFNGYYSKAQYQAEVEARQSAATAASASTPPPPSSFS